MDFILKLRSAMKNIGITNAELAKRTGVSNGFPGIILSCPDRRKTPPHIPDGEAEKWADALKLEGNDRQEFLLANAWHYASSDQRKVYRTLVEKIEEFNAMMPKIAALLDSRRLESEQGGR